MKEARDALGLEARVDERLERAARELTFDEREHARELCDQVLETLPPDSERRAYALYLRGLAREGEGAEDLAAAVVACERHLDPLGAARARLALARVLAETDGPAALEVLEEALDRLGPHDLPLEHANVLLALARLELAAGARGAAARRARQALERLDGVLRLEARRLEVLAIELQADAADHAPEALRLLDRALAQAERMELGRARVLRDKRAALRAHQGPFR